MTARKGKRKAVDNLYASLTAQELAKLLARLYREQDDKEMLRLRDNIPPGRADEYNRIARILNNLELLGGLALRVTWLAMERCTLFLAHELDEYAKTWRARSHAYTASKLLPGYPVTESEYRALIAAQRDRRELLDDFAGYITDGAWDNTDTGLHPTVRAWLAEEMPNDVPDEEHWPQAKREVRGLLDAAIERGELPAPQDTPDGPALTWGILHDWLTGTTAETFEPYSPEYYIPTLEALNAHIGLAWDIRPDSEGDDVRRRREHICETLATIWELNDAQRAQINPHPPETMEQSEREQREWEAVWPSRPKPETRELLLKFQAMYLDIRLEMLSLAAAFETIRREDFYGEDALPEHVRKTLEDARQASERFCEAWSWGQEQVRDPWEPGNALPDIPEPDAAELERLTAETVKGIRAFR